MNAIQRSTATVAVKATRLCTVDGCERPLYAKGICEAHYARLRKTGSTGGADVRSRPRGGTIDQRFNLYVRKHAGPGECWGWGGPVNGYNEYSTMLVNGKRILAHRWSLEQKLGRSLGPGEEAMHICDNPPCCNPEHLRPGTHAENMADMRSKGRGISPVSVANTVKTHCIRGHAFDEVNTVVEKSGKRQCRACNKIRHDAYLTRKRYRESLSRS